MDGVARCERYVDRVLSGDIVAPLTIRQACERFQADKQREDITLNAEAANAVVRNVERMVHIKGRWRGQRVELGDWQCFFFVNVFGWYRLDGRRRFRYAYLFCPRKQGKTATAVWAALNCFAADGEPGAEVYLGATGQEQARDLLFRPAKETVRQTPKMADAYGIECNASTLVIPESFSVLKTVIRKPDDGYSPHCAVVDEYHQHDTDDQWSTFDTGMGARDQPLLITVTTAGTTVGGPCHDYHDDCKEILAGKRDGDTTFAQIYEPDDGDAWDDPETLWKVSPNAGVSVHRDYLLDQLKQAKESSNKQNAFRTKHLNQWVGASVAWMNALAWQRQKTAMTLDAFEGKRAMVAMDLASKLDLTAMVICFREAGVYQVFARFYACEDAVRNSKDYQRFKAQGLLTETPGAETDYAFLERDLTEWLGRFDVANVATDPYQSAYLRQRLADVVDIYEYRQSLTNMSEPMQEVEAAVRNKRLDHDGNALLSWCVANTQAWWTSDGKLCRPIKQRKDSPMKIDGAVAMIMSVGLWLHEPEEGALDDWLSDPVMSA